MRGPAAASRVGESGRPGAGEQDERRQAIDNPLPGTDLRSTATLAALALSLIGPIGTGHGESAPPDEPGPRLRLRDALEKNSRLPLRFGTYTVYEDRAARAGRTIDLEVFVLPATGPDPRPDPIFYLVGGPGQAATGAFRRLIGSWMNEDRDIVLVSQRGTGRSNGLDCDVVGSDEDLQSYLEVLFRPRLFQQCRDLLAERADLTKYTTPIAMDDLNEVRAALGYDRINLVGGSYGTRAALVYMRRHPETVRSAILMGVAPVSFTNPLYHAREGQRALDMIFAECAADPDCHAAFPDLEREFEAVLERLDDASADATVRHPETGEPVSLKLSRDAFAGALRLIMYYDNSDVPLLIHRAFAGDYDAFANRGLTSNRAIRGQLAFGMLLCVTCSEDIPRIDPDDIPQLTEGTFLGDGRVRRQMAVCEVWPRGDVPADYGDPVSVDVPVLLLSGEYDPVTPPRWGEETARHLPASLHVVVPTTHSFGSSCIDQIMRDFLDRGTVEGLDTSCVEHMRRPRFTLPP
ncbi:MAG: alpha/beta hydrolase [Planctomycetota bacterium]